MIIWLRYVKQSFIQAVDSDRVQLFQAIVYSGVFYAGIYMIAFGTAYYGSR